MPACKVTTFVDTEYIPYMRMLRWMGSVNQQQFAATLATAQYLCDERFYKMPVKKFIDMTTGTCCCPTKDLKFTVLKRMAEFHGDGLAECIGMYLVRLQDEAPGRENGILFFGEATGTGKSTLALALIGIFPDSMAFVPVPDSKFPYDTYDAAKVKAQLLDEFRTDVEGFTPQLILRATGGDKRLKISQKGVSGCDFVGENGFLPRTVMTTNYLQPKGQWKGPDIAALKNRFCALYHFHKDIDPLKKLTPKNFNINEECRCCSRKWARHCRAQYVKNPHLGEQHAAHLKDKNYMNDKLILHAARKDSGRQNDTCDNFFR